VLLRLLRLVVPWEFAASNPTSTQQFSYDSRYLGATYGR
jgi:hypothetical protein